MTQPVAVPLTHRAILSVSGPDTRGFLQGITSNDVMSVSGERSIWSAFLTPQGKFLHEFVVTADPGTRNPEATDAADTLWLDVEAGRQDHLHKRLKVYRLRSKAEITPRADLKVYALLGERGLGLLDLPALEGYTRPLGDGMVCVDPRLAILGGRAILPSATAEATLEAAGFAFDTLEAYDRLRLELGIPDGSRDLEPERATLMESGFDELHGVSWDKGCYLGQELTARMKYRGLAKKRLVPVTIEGPTPPIGSEIRRNGKVAGTLRSAVDGVGLALLKLNQIDTDPGTEPLQAGDAQLTPQKPAWAQF